MMFASTIAGLVALLSNFELATGTAHKVTWDWVQSLSIAIYDLLVCESHWLFACYYFKIANNTPVALQN